MTRKDEFLEKFKSLLREYNAEIDIQITASGNYEFIRTLRIYGNHVFSEGNIIHDSFEINLGGWENGK